MTDQFPSKRRDWIEAHADYPHKDWCLIWPFSRNPAGYAQVEGPVRSVNRIMCERRNGPAPSSDHQAAHSCDRGHEACVNPWHLDWKTNVENQLDKRRKGWQPKCKITVDQAREIRDLKGLERTGDTAARFGITHSNVLRIQSGQAWRDDSRSQSILTPDQVADIKSRPSGKGVTAAMAQEFGIAESSIYRIRNGKNYKRPRGNKGGDLNGK